MCDDIEVHFDAKRSYVSLTCGKEAFSRLRNLVFEEAGMTEALDPPFCEAQRIEIEFVPDVEANGLKGGD